MPMSDSVPSKTQNDTLDKKCENCRGKCCRYILVDIPAPRARLDYNNYGWYLAHENTAIYIDSGKWYLAIFNKCRYLGDNNRCNVYHQRFQACIDHSDTNCEYDGDNVADVVFREPFELLEFAEKKFLQIAAKRKLTLKQNLKSKH